MENKQEHKHRRPAGKKIAFISILLLAVALVGTYTSYHYLHPEANDRFADARMEEMRAADLPRGIERRELSRGVDTLAGYGFVAYAGIVVYSEWDAGETQALLQAVPGLENAILMPVDAEFEGSDYDAACTLHFSGIQKELDGQDSSGYYIALVLYDAPRRFEFRNSEQFGFMRVVPHY